MKRMIYLMGTDGSGKTTLAKNLTVHYKSENKKVKYLYARYHPILIVPIKIFNNIFLYKKDTEFKNYNNYSNIKGEFGNKHRILARLYAFACVMDYIIFTWLKVMYKYLTAENIIVDRYIGDLVVILSVASGLSEKEMLRLLTLLHRLFPIPTDSFFIDLEEETAFKRKHDIPSLQYLKERKHKYFLFKKFYQFKILDGNLNPDELLNRVINSMSNN